MFFPTMIVKQSSLNEIKVINLSNDNEAILDEEAYEMLTAISKKDSRENCSQNELDFLSLLLESLDMTVANGSKDLTIRSGDFENLEVYLANTCNLRCKHCYFFGEGRHKIKKFIDFDVLVNTIVDAEKMGLYKIKLCGGEPLTYYRMKELCHFLNSRSISTTIISNGLLLHKFLDELDNSKVSFVISLDGFASSHDYLRGKRTFERTRSNIEKAVKAGFDVQINMAVYDRNVNDIDSFTDLVKNMGVSGLNMQVVRPVGMAADKLKGSTIVDESFLRRIHQNELEDQASKVENGSSFCTSCKTGLTIDFNNDVIGCPFISAKPIGNLCSSESLEKIQERSLKENPLYFVREKADCLSCELFNVVCAGGCRARAKRMTGSIYACDYWIPFLLNHPKFKESKKEAWEYLLI